MDAQVFQVRFGQEGTDRVGQAADAELQCRPVGNLLNNGLGNLGVDVITCRKGNRRQGMVAVFDDSVDIADMDTFAAAAENAGHGFIDFDDDLLGLLGDGFRCRDGQAEIEEAVFIHGADGNQGHVDVEEVAVHGRLVAVAHGDEIHLAEGAFFPVIAAHMPVHSRKGLAFRVLFDDLPRRYGKTHADLDILQFIPSGCQGLVEEDWLSRAHTVIDPIPGFNDFHSFFRRHQFLFVHICPLGHKNHPFV